MMKVKNDEAEKIRQEFVDFSYAVSHDLNAPLRHIKAFTAILLRGLEQDQLTMEQKECADFITNSVERMQAMLDGLTQFSRLNTVTKPFDDVNLKDILEKSVTLFQNQVSDVGGTVSLCGAFPDVHADAHQLLQAFNAVFDNALKFRHPERPLAIQISCEKKVLTFQDNGLGVMPNQLENAFKPFKQLHPVGAYPGVGMGLAIVEKIAKQHSGSIALESDGETGTAVILSFPSQ